MKRILMVCLGNICRSPLAEGILKSKVNPATVKVDSAGTAAYHVGNLPDPRSIETGLHYGIDIRDQRARAFSQSDFDAYDHIYAMDASNYKNILNIARDAEDSAKVSMILNEIFPGEDREVPDPYYGGNRGFEEVYQLLDAACERIASKLNN